jgi:hypothetical protein
VISGALQVVEKNCLAKKIVSDFNLALHVVVLFSLNNAFQLAIGPNQRINV